MTIHMELSSELLAVIDLLEYEFGKKMQWKDEDSDAGVEIFIDMKFLRSASTMRIETLCEVMRILESRIEGMRIVNMYNSEDEETPWPEELHVTRFQTFAQIMLPSNFEAEAQRLKSELQTEPNSQPKIAPIPVGLFRIELNYTKGILLFGKDGKRIKYRALRSSTKIFKAIEYLTKEQRVSKSILADAVQQDPRMLKRSIEEFNKNCARKLNTGVGPVQIIDDEEFALDTNAYSFTRVQ